MSKQINHISNQSVLIAPLDWGMGHTTRCYSIVRDLLINDNTVVFAGDEKQRGWMKREFPAIQTVHLEGYQITLDSRKNTYVQLLSQFQKMKRAIRSEKKWVKNYCQENKVDLIISDNRYGFHHEKIKSIILTHQLNLQIPFGGALVNRKLKNWLEKFDQVWVPDFADHQLTGLLSKRNLDIPIDFIGPLNRFPAYPTEKNHDYLVILSGPEPERSHFLNRMMEKAKVSDLDWAFVGVELNEYPSFINPSTNELAELMAKSETIISRAGYTTLMELTQLKKKAILYPTKGQYEQEYLSGRLYEGVEFKIL